MWQYIDISGGPHDGCRVRVPPDAPPTTIWLPAERVADTHAVWAFQRSGQRPLEYRLDDPGDEPPLYVAVAR